MSDRRCCDCKHEQLYVTGKHCDACYHVEGHPNFDPNEKGRLRSRVAELEARVVELEREKADECAASKARLAALEWLRIGCDEPQPRPDFYELMSAVIDATVGPREGEQ